MSEESIEQDPFSPENIDVSRSDDPFHPANIGIIQFIMLGRIYDVLMLQLQLTNSEACAKLQEIHASGALVGTSPNFNGQFLSDEP